MSEDDEVLPLDSELSRHMISEGFTAFTTYNQFVPFRSPQRTTLDSSSVHVSNTVNKTVEMTSISPSDQAKLISLLNSKLLLPEDFEILEFLISRTKTSNCQSYYFWAYYGSVIASTVSLTLFLSNRVSFLLPATLVSTLSFLSLRHCYNYLRDEYENKTFISTVGCLQSLCLNVSKLLRLLKETEILSTGQVTTYNVGAALYIPIKSLAEQRSLPTWKTLPHLRKYLANALLDIIDLLKSACAEARKIAPNWLFVEGYSLSNESSPPDILNVDRLCKSEDCISLKHLQLLNDSYLVLQSELLRWIGFCICPSAWSTSDSNYISSRIKILKLFCNVHSQLSVISYKLKSQYDIQNIFVESDPLISQRVKDSNMTEINNLQTELHKLYLLIVSMLIHLKSLEDQLELNTNSVPNCGVNNLKETIIDQMKNVREELKSAVNMFDLICIQSFQNPKSVHIQSDKLDKEQLDSTIPSFHLNQPAETISQSDCYIKNSLDEVFLAVTDFDRNVQEREDWDNENKPLIPNTLLAELSTTLKPIKENFKEREKAALERAGLEDINNESDDGSGATDKNLHVNTPLSKPLSRNKKKRIAKKLKITNYELLSNKSDDTESDSAEELITERNATQNTSILEDEPRTSCTVLNNKSIASMIALKSQTWGLAEEECYSDN